MSDLIYTPNHYTNKDIQTIDAIEPVTMVMRGDKGNHLGNVLKYADRADHKGNRLADLTKSNNYAHRLCLGVWANPGTVDLAKTDGVVDVICAGLPGKYAILLSAIIRFALGIEVERDIPLARQMARTLNDLICENEKTQKKIDPRDELSENAKAIYDKMLASLVG